MELLAEVTCRVDRSNPSEAIGATDHEAAAGPMCTAQRVTRGELHNLKYEKERKRSFSELHMGGYCSFGGVVAAVDLLSLLLYRKSPEGSSHPARQESSFPAYKKHTHKTLVLRTPHRTASLRAGALLYYTARDAEQCHTKNRTA